MSDKKYLSVGKDGTEYLHDFEPMRRNDFEWYSDAGNVVKLGKGTIEGLIGYKLNFETTPVRVRVYNDFNK